MVVKVDKSNIFISSIYLNILIEILEIITDTTAYTTDNKIT